jgi:uncharacterized protein (TIGR02145 family)
MRHIIYLFTLTATILSACNPNSDDPNNDDTGEVLINGVRWATTNVDAPGKFAAKPEDFGMLYQWGKNVGWSATDPLVSSNGGTTWDESSASGDVWASAEDPCPDGWQVPTAADFEALGDRDKVRSAWTMQGGIFGNLFVDMATGESIFLPSAGFRYDSDGSVYNPGNYGCYWSSTGKDSVSGYYLYFYIEFIYPSYSATRANGFSVRCVRK